MNLTPLSIYIPGPYLTFIAPMNTPEVLPNMGHRVQFNPEENTVTGARTLRISGGSTVLTIPPEVLDVLEWEDGDDLRLEADYEEGSLIIEATE